ncbi:hypothetical protein HRR81_000742 [Exophiala dermatitidis]|nr:hypothetical protein HRR79_000743 [Exophiala dermatitidis]KAJ4584935.1 hypothetical protein HRR81_000742 [Exophiala dermatitidis]KAJ4589951.1 hypothetical protein HRR82_000339 [Exophiala dermatitidis]KAJ9005066.1 hypothetical protein HRR94_000742 [Exophiala dermatitidis]
MNAETGWNRYVLKQARVGRLVSLAYQSSRKDEDEFPHGRRGHVSVSTPECAPTLAVYGSGTCVACSNRSFGFISWTRRQNGSEPIPTFLKARLQRGSIVACMIHWLQRSVADPVTVLPMDTLCERDATSPEGRAPVVGHRSRLTYNVSNSPLQ